MNPDRFARLKRILSRRQPDLTVLMERVNKGRNFSAILRSCDATGVLEAHAVLPDRGLDVHRQESAGTAKWIRVQTHDSVQAAVKQLKDRGFRILAAHPDARATDYRKVDLVSPVALLVGAELDGISDAGLALADEIVSIPMVGMARSLNVSVAVAVLLFEAYRQREAAGLYRFPRLPEEAFRRLLFEWAYPKVARARRRMGLPYPSLSRDGEILD